MKKRVVTLLIGDDTVFNRDQEQEQAKRAEDALAALDREGEG